MNTVLLSFASGYVAGWMCRHVTPVHVAHAFSHTVSFVAWCLRGFPTPPHQALEKVSRHRYDLTYTHNGVPYKVVVPVRRGPRYIDRVHNEHGHDVTDTVLPYSGPSEDFHKQTLTPEDLGHARLTFHFRNGETRVFSTGDRLVLV